MTTKDTQQVSSRGAFDDVLATRASMTNAEFLQLIQWLAAINKCPLAGIHKVCGRGLWKFIHPRLSLMSTLLTEYTQRLTQAGDLHDRHPNT